MTGLRVPRQEAENPQPSGNDLFPAGTFVFEIVPPTDEDMRIRQQSFDELPDWMTTEPDWGGTSYATGDLTELNVWLQQRAVVASDVDPGEQIFFQRFVVVDGSIPIADVNLDQENGEGTAIRRDARLWAGLNLALNAVSIEEEDGVEFVVPAPNATQLHTSGAFDGKQVIAEVMHRWNKAKTKERAQIVRFEALS